MHQRAGKHAGLAALAFLRINKDKPPLSFFPAQPTGFAAGHIDANDGHARKFNKIPSGNCAHKWWTFPLAFFHGNTLLDCKNLNILHVN
jgi:hypothetical protein